MINMANNNDKKRIRFSVLELRIIIDDMDNRHFSYNKLQKDAHWQLRCKLYRSMSGG